MKKVLLNLALVAALCFLPSAYSYQSCEACPQYCTSCYSTGTAFIITGAQKGYSIDNQNGLCYPTCNSTQFYDYNQRQCISCGYGCATCTYVNSTFRVTSALQGFSIDTVVNTCYSCSSSQYYDPFRHQCVDCPPGCTSCKFQQFSNYAYNVTVLQAQKGYIIDDPSNTCVQVCSNGQWYNVKSGKCESCPNKCSSCYGGVNGVVVLTASSGYSVDSDNQLCYQSCSSAQYYNSQSLSCVDCPSGCASCSYKFGVLSITSAKSGFSVDSINGVCYKSCSNGQYYSPSLLDCQQCPQGCNSCYYANGGIVIQSASSGYSIDTINGVCYQTCNSTAYYKPF